MAIEKDNIHAKLPETLIAVGTSQEAMKICKKAIERFTGALLEYLPQESAFYGRIQRRYAQLVRLSTLYGSGNYQHSKVLTLRQECNTVFLMADQAF